MATSRRAAPVPAVIETDSSLPVRATSVPMSQQEQQIAILNRLINSNQLPGHVTNVAQAYTIAKMGRELGFPIMQAFHFIIPIQGKLTLSARAIGALMRRNNVTMETLEDGVYVYQNGETTEYRKTGDERPIDRRTTIKFTRNGISENVTFTWIDATAQELVTKSNWKRMPKEMLYARCLSKGANRIGQDFMMGLYSTDEIFDSMGEIDLNVVRDEDGHITELITPHTEVRQQETAVA